MLDLKLIDSINCNRNETSSSHLRDYHPSKTLPIPGDGNCLFSSISYYLTGSIDIFHNIRTNVAENKCRKLKEACNEFILNKYPQTVVSYFTRVCTKTP